MNLLHNFKRNAFLSREALRFLFDKSHRTSDIRIHYGKNAGDVGGPSVKVKRLSNAFPQCKQNVNILYSINGHCPQYVICRIGKIKKIPIVYNGNGVFYKAWYGDGWEKRNEKLRRVYKLSDYIFFQSNFSKLSAETFLGKPPCSHEILYNAVDTDHFKPLFFKKNKFSILLICHHEFYRLKIAIEMFSAIRKQLTGAKLLIAGNQFDSFQRNEIHVFLKKHNLSDHVVFLGQFTQEEAPRIYNKADLLFHPQINDVCPSTVIEAMACGLPVVYSATGGAPELVGNEAGSGVPGGLNWEKIEMPPVHEWAVHVLKVAENLESMREAARARAVEKFHINNWILRHRIIFENLLSK